MLSPIWGTFAPFVLYAWRRGAGVPLAVLLQCSGSVWTWSNARAVPGESGSHEGLCPTIPSGSGWRWCFPAFGFCMNLCSRAQGRRVGAALPLCPPWLRPSPFMRLRSDVSLMGCTGKAARGTRSHGNPHFGDSRVPSSCSRRAKERVGTRIGTCWAAQLGLQPCRQKWEQQPLWFVSLLFPCLCLYVCLFVCSLK